MCCLSPSPRYRGRALCQAPGRGWRHRWGRAARQDPCLSGATLARPRMNKDQEDVKWWPCACQRQRRSRAEGRPTWLREHAKPPWHGCPTSGERWGPGGRVRPSRCSAHTQTYVHTHTHAITDRPTPRNAYRQTQTHVKAYAEVHAVTDTHPEIHTDAHDHAPRDTHTHTHDHTVRYTDTHQGDRKTEPRGRVTGERRRKRPVGATHALQPPPRASHRLPVQTDGDFARVEWTVSFLCRPGGNSSEQSPRAVVVRDGAGQCG